MKTSTSIFLVAIFLLGIGLVAYDFQLRTVFRKGDYTRAGYDYRILPYRGFDRIRLNASTALNIRLVKGDFKVLAAPGTRDFLSIRQQGDQLTIDALFQDHYRGLNADFALYISCPDLKEIRADAEYRVGEEPHTDKTWMEWGKISVISGFRLDSLTITENNASHLVLTKDTINTLTAVVAPGAALTIGAANKIAGGDMEVGNQARLIVRTPEVPALRYRLADSAAVELSGAAAHQLIKTSQP
ncbi:MAG TPA: hypothetical protein VN616_13290 [Puia sp.]|nr:hypothetical protein [Puia sp.]